MVSTRVYQVPAVYPGYLQHQPEIYLNPKGLHFGHESWSLCSEDFHDLVFLTAHFS